MRLKISHTTAYRYDEPVTYALQQVRLTPQSCASQKVLHWDIAYDGGKVQAVYHDQFGNAVMLVGLEPGASHFDIKVEGEVETHDTGGIIGPSSGYAPLWYFRRSTALTEAGKNVRVFADSAREGHSAGVECLHALSARILESVSYRVGTTDAKTTAEEAVSNGSGVCQDHAHIFLAAARLLGHPARYVSGFLMMNDRVEQEAGHAWAEAHVDGLGWVGFDISNGISPDTRYVRVATGLDYRDAAPVSGMRFGNSAETMSVSLQVQQQ